MSIAGIHSNRGDGYQTLVALDWALTVISDPTYLWLEIDSISYPVDDVVVGKADGSLISCQCKKNQTNFKAWSITDLADELDKAARLIENNQNVEIRFYSRNNFGELAKLKEYSSTQNDQISYEMSLGKQHRAIDTALKARLASLSPSLSSFEFLRRIKFITSDELERMVDLIHERLRRMATNSDAAFTVLWATLDQLGARMTGGNTSAIQYRLTKKELQAILDKAGVILSPQMDLAKVRLSFAGISAIGRAWRRDIAEQRLPNLVVNELLAAIDSNKRSILLTGLPGSGKTCVMLALQEILEQRAKSQPNFVPLFIQSREFAELTTSEDRKSQGLPEQWVEEAARLADSAQVIVIIDSLDVLSIARDHRVLSYFLAQIDRLLLVPNISVVTACRDFDRNYDHRIAERKWDFELKCKPLDWDAQVRPLLDILEIATVSIDKDTRELITNPRELALFVELAQRQGTFNAVTGQALAQRYLNTIVRADTSLGDAAIKAIEDMALEMLNARSLVIPHQRFGASQDILRALCSLNVLQETQEGKLTLGHQTLLDVLVISGAVRSGVTLNRFIQSLPPVPFVRPSIRSFVAQLALGERREFRKQLRTVLMGSAAFHIRRLIAESFAEQKPQDEDWLLIRDLRENHRDVFQVIYGARAIEWHYFWLKHLVPDLKRSRDSEGMTRHVYHIAQWADEDTVGVLGIWLEALSLDWLDTSNIAGQLGFHLSEIKSENIAPIVPLIVRLLDLPRPDHDSLGRTIARCVAAGLADDSLLWRYIVDGVSDDDVLGFRFSNKLRCKQHQFGDREGSFISQRMVRSTALMDLAVESIERWSDIYKSRFGETRIGYRHGFLGNTSYDNEYSQNGRRHSDNLNVLLDAIETAIIYHAKIDSDWWRKNRERLCFNHEGALLYFAVLACTSSPKANIDLIGQMLCDKNLLEFELSYELGTLIQSTFTLLDISTQDSVIANILTLWEEEFSHEPSLFWVLRSRAEFIVAVPCYQRTPETQAMLDLYEKKGGKLIRQPNRRSGCGFVRAPFSFEVFLNSVNATVLSLLSHYAGYERHFDDFLIGGEREVGVQLREASSRHPTRFLGLLQKYWGDISNQFRDDILDGVTTYLAHRHGNLQTNSSWIPIEDSDGVVLASLILDELERHPIYWQHQRSAAKSIEICSKVIYDAKNAERLIFLAIDFEGLQEDDPIKGNNVNLLTMGINMAKGNVAEALLILLNNLNDQGGELPELLVPTVLRFADQEHPAVRALILRRLPYLQSKSFDLGWDLFHRVMQSADQLWEIAEPCLYYAYHNHFELVRPLLARIYNEGSGKDFETWGRISALAAMTQHIDLAKLVEDLTILNSAEAWHGASTVWADARNFQQHQEQCISGLEAGLNAGGIHAEAVAEQIEHLFNQESAMISIPVELIERCFDVFKIESDNQKKHHRLFGFHDWLNVTSQFDPDKALAAMEIYLAYVTHSKPYLFDIENRLTQLMTRLFAEAEEREESDRGAMLQRVVAAQDTFLSLGISSVADWLKAAERP